VGFEDREPPRAGPISSQAPSPASSLAAAPRPLSPPGGVASSEVAALRTELREIRTQLEALAAEQEQQARNCDASKDALGG